MSAKAKAAIEIIKIVGEKAWTMIDPPSELKSKFRNTSVTINNKTQFEIQWTGKEYFDSGRFWEAPSSISATEQGQFSICNKDSSFATGASAGGVFKVKLPGGNDFEFALGASNPAFGGYKIAVVASGSAKDGYERLGNGSATMSHSFETETSEGKVAITLNFIATPGNLASLNISEEHRKL